MSSKLVFNPFTGNFDQISEITLGAVGSSPNPEGASLDGQELILQPANQGSPGVVTEGAQSFGGVKTFTDNVLFVDSTGIDSESVPGAQLNVGTTNASTINVSSPGNTIGLNGDVQVSGGTDFYFNQISPSAPLHVDGDNIVTSGPITNTDLDVAAANTIKGNNTGSPATPIDLTTSQVKTMLDLTGTNSGNVTLSGENYLSISTQAITVSAVNLGNTNVTGTLTVAKGGTGIGSGTSGGIPYYSGSTTIASSAALTNHGVVIGGGTGAAPKSTSAGSSGQVLTSNGASADPTFQTLTAATTTLNNIASTALSADLNFNKSSAIIQGRANSSGDLIRVQGGTGTVSIGGDAILRGGNSSAGGTDGALITAGGGQDVFGGGNAVVLGGTPGASSTPGGAATVQGGTGNSAAGGLVSLIGGTGGNFGAGGGIAITGGNSGGGGSPNGGDITITPGTATGGGANGYVNIVTGNTTGAQVATLTNSPVVGNPTGWLKIKIGGTISYIPFWQ